MTMAGILKHWRESASLIIASKRLVMKQPKQSVVNKLLKKKPEQIENTNEELLRLLLLKRSSGSSSMPNVYVFPGGMIDNSDFSKDWLDVFGNNKDLLNIFSRQDHGSPIFSRSRDPKLFYLSSDIALRIAAIRETFEETGILLARSKSDLADKDLFSNTNAAFTTVCTLPEGTAAEWRRHIVSDSSQFLTMCKELGMVPDIWSLYEWSNWMTPPMKGKRFDTAFFISCIDEAPEITLSDESSHGVWSNPEDVLKECSDGLVAIAPPQMYELSRLVRFGSVDELLNFAWKRSSCRVKRWMPIIYSCSDGTIFALPGDDLYFDNTDLTGEEMQIPIHRPETIVELQKLYPHHHRAVINKDKLISLHCNVDFVDGHLLPREFNNKSVVQRQL